MAIHIVLKPGDVFASRNPQGLGSMILLTQKMKSLDGEAEYGHTGIIIDEAGTTFEALWTIKRQNLFEAYKGNKILIARWQGMTMNAFWKGFNAVAGQEGRPYPFYRLFLMLIGLGKVRVPDQEVCSEITTHMLVAAGADVLSGDNWCGVTPDNLVDEWRISKYFDVIFEGIL
jgi:hypothetical protein